MTATQMAWIEQVTFHCLRRPSSCLSRCDRPCRYASCVVGLCVPLGHSYEHWSMMLVRRSRSSLV